MIEHAFSAVKMTSLLLCATGLILFLPEIFKRKEAVKSPVVGILSAFIIGIAQAVAVLPGISRSGSTITCARLLGIDPKEAARFSFLLSIPAILGATILKIKDVEQWSFALFVSAAFAALFGFIAITIVERFLTGRKFWVFGIYALVAGLLGFIFVS